MRRSAFEVMAEVQDRHWWFRARRRLLADLLGGVGCPARVLEVGCGTGSSVETLRAIGPVVGVDVDAGALARAVRRGYEAVVQADGQDLPFRDGSFDVAVALDVLEHIPNDERACREVRRVLRPGGTFVVFVPAFSWLWGLQDEVSGHLRRYTRHQLEDLLASAGFRDIRIGYFNTFLLPAVAAVRALWRVLRWESASENEWTPAVLDGPLAGLLELERRLGRFFSPPIGVSLYAVARRVGSRGPEA